MDRINEPQYTRNVTAALTTCEQPHMAYLDVTTGLEIWKPVVEAPEKYEVSSLGRVRSLVTGKLKRQFPRSKCNPEQQYPCVGIYPHGGKQPTIRAVHILMLEAFIGPRPSGNVGRHLDDDKHRNVLTNLAWGTHEDNEADKRRNQHDLDTFGERHYHAKYSDAQVEAIRASAGTARDVAMRLGVKSSFVADIRLGRSRKRKTAEAPCK